MKTSVVSIKTRLIPGLLAIAVIGIGAISAEAQVLLSFKGTSQFDNAALGRNFIPPDTMGAIGTTQYMEFSNGSIAVYDKANGNLLSRVSDLAFWGSVGQTAAANGDQRVLFDLHTNRWIATGFGGSLSNIQIAISDTADALGTWKSTQFTGFAGGIADYPTLAIDEKAVYIGTNNFSSGGAFQGVSLNVIQKSDLFGGAPTTANKTTFNTPYPGTGTNNGFAIQAAVSWDTNPSNTGYVMADSINSNEQVFYKVNGVNAPGATQTASAVIAGSQYVDGPGDGRQPDGSRIIDTLDTRISANVMQSNGKLYSVMTIAGPDNGSGPNSHSAVRWSVNDANTGNLISSGLIADANFDFFQGSIAVNQFGQVVIGYNRSGYQTEDLNGDGLADGNISFMARTFQTNGLGSLDMLDEYLLKVSPVSDYHNGSILGQPAAGRQRWGDYSSVTLDPDNPYNFWAIGQYAEVFNSPEYGYPNGTGGSRWGTWISEISFGMQSVPDGGMTLTLLGSALLGLMAFRRRFLS